MSTFSDMECTKEITWEQTYFKKCEVAVHNGADDCWVIIDGIVRNITPLVQEYLGRPESRPLIAEAGKDISHWFDEKGEILRHMHPVTNDDMPYLPHGPIPDVSDVYLASPSWFPTPTLPWWRNQLYFVGRVSANERPIRIKNTLCRGDIVLMVCEEDKIGGRIWERYSAYNSSLGSYTWKYRGQVLDMDKTLTENGIEDIRPRLRALRLPDHLYIPAILLYYNDDFEDI